MMKCAQLNKKGILFIAGAILLLSASLVFIFHYHSIAFPGQSIHFRLSQEEAESAAEKLLTKNGFSFQEFDRRASRFTYPKTTKIFIEKELGVEASHDFFTNQFNIWQWSVRFFNLLEKEEIYVNLSTTGQLRYFERSLKEERAINSVSGARAERIASQFITDNTSHELDNWSLTDKSTEAQKNRVDYSFTFKKQNVEIYDAQFEIEVIVKGDQVGYFHEYLKVPEYWQRDYKALRSQNETTSMIAMAFLILLGLSSVGLFIYQVLKQQVRLKAGLIFGSITTIIYFFSQLNNLPLTLYYYDKMQPLSSFYTDVTIQYLTNALLYGMAVFFLAAAGSTLYKKMSPNRMALLDSFSWKGMQTKSFFYSTIVGFVAAFLFIVFQILFYIGAQKFGAWSPASVNYSTVLNTQFPWIYIIFSGFIPAVTEEFCFRLYGIPVFQKISKSKLFAVIITAIVWGFAHANYPNQPFWIRGVEVSLFGIAAGYMFVYFGIVAVLVWHYTVDAFLTIIMFSQSGNMALLIPTILAGSLALFLLGYNLIFYVKNGGFRQLENKSQEEADEKIRTKAVSSAVAHVSTVLPRFSKKQLYILFIVLLLFIAALFIPLKKPGDYISYSLSEKEVLETGKRFLNEQGIDPNRFETVVGLEAHCNAACVKFFTEKTSTDSANYIFSHYLPNVVSYKIRFFKEKEREEYIVYVHPMDNSVIAFNHILEEEAIAYDLSRDLALIRVNQFLAQQNYEINQFKLVETNSEKLENRTDHHFVYESIPNHDANIDEARLRLSLTVKGDELAFFKSYYKIPEQWLLAEKKESDLTTLRKILQFLLLPGFLVGVLLSNRDHFNMANIPWKILLYSGAALFIGLIVKNLINLESSFIYYDTSWTKVNFIITLFFSELIHGLYITLLFLLILVLAFAYYGSGSILRDIQKSQKNGFDGLMAGLLSTAGLSIIFIIYQHLIGIFPQFMISTGFSLPYYLVDNFYLVDFVIKLVMNSIIFALLLYSLGAIIFRKKRYFLLLILLSASALPVSIDSLSQFLFSYLFFFIVILWLYICQRFILRNNLLAYLVAGISFFSIYYSRNMIATGNTGAIVAGYFFIGVLLLMIAWLMIKDETNWLERVLN